jgi:outer membrane protein assembly factor BamB
MMREWYPISGNNVWDEGYPINRYVPYNEDAPETAHILWTKEQQMGGLVGEPMGDQSGECGAAYETRFNNAMVLGGTLYYTPRESRSPIDRTVAVDLRTGEERWNQELTDPDGGKHRLAFGQAFYWDSYNYHGVFYYLWVTDGSTWHAFDPTTGDWVYTMTDVPRGVETRTEKDEILRYVVDNDNGWMALWNSSRVVSQQGSWRPHGNTYNCTTRGWEWNVTIPIGLPGAGSEIGGYQAGGFRFAKAGDKIIGCNGTSYGRTPIDICYVYALDLSEGHEGALLFNEPYNVEAISGEKAHTLRWAETWMDWETDTFLQWSRTMHQFYAFSGDTGKYLWQTKTTIEDSGFPLDIYGTNSAIHGGFIYLLHYGGYLYCYDMEDGSTKWVTEIEDPYAEYKFSNNWGTAYDGLFLSDDKVYIIHHEHSPIDPKDRGSPFGAYDAETGEEVFRLNSAFSGYSGTSFGIADSIVFFQNTYDMQIYAVGKGPSATTVTAPDVSTELGKSVLIKGTVMDVSPGTNDPNRVMRFPNGVPAAADEGMSEWMQYVYQQFPKPANAAGVEVVIYVLDANGNYYEVGRTTTDASGGFKLSFEPLVPGEYTVTAAFEGSKSYWPSNANTYMSVTEAPADHPAPTPAPASIADVYFLPVSIGLLIAIVVVGVVIVLMLRKL